jgi:N-methylhydantoinase B
MKSRLEHSFLEAMLSSFDSAAIVLSNGETLALKYETLADIGTAPMAAQTVIKYFKLQMGDVILLNDPYSGGSTLSMMSLVTPICKNQKNLQDLYLVLRFGFKSKFVISESLDEEGLRIPPTPIVMGGKIQEPILEALIAHPDAPEGFKPKLLAQIDLLKKRIAAFNTLIKNRPNLFTNIQIKDYLKESSSHFEKIISEVAHGEARSEVKLIDAGNESTSLKLRLSISAGQIDFDFSGTGATKKMGLTDAATFGACVGAVMAFLQTPIRLNSGVFSRLNVTTPLGCFLNAKYPTPTFRGMNEGLQIVASTALQSLMGLQKKRKTAASSLSPNYISLDFENQKRFFDALPGGAGAASDNEGSDALYFWIRNRLQNSVQEIENRFPLQILSAGIRVDSGGEGQNRGGHGMQKEYLLNADALFSWSAPSLKNQAQGIDGGKAGKPAEITIHQPGKPELAVNQLYGKMQLPKGSRIVVCSGGGGGFGKPSTN